MRKGRRGRRSEHDERVRTGGRRRTDERAGRREKHVKGRSKPREAERRGRSGVGRGHRRDEEREDMLKE